KPVDGRRTAIPSDDGEEEEQPEEYGPTGQSDSARQAKWKIFAEYVRELNKVQCPCLIPEWDDRVEDREAAEVTISHFCGRCGQSKSSTFSMDRLWQISEELADG